MEKLVAGLSVIISPVYVKGTAFLQAFGKRACHTVAMTSDEKAVGLRSRFA